MSTARFLVLTVTAVVLLVGYHLLLPTLAARVGGANVLVANRTLIYWGIPIVITVFYYLLFGWRWKKASRIQKITFPIVCLLVPYFALLILLFSACVTGVCI